MWEDEEKFITVAELLKHADGAQQQGDTFENYP